MNNKSRSYTRVKFNQLAREAKKYIESLPPDDLFSRLDVRVPAAARERRNSNNEDASIGLYMPPKIQQPAKATLPTVMGIMKMLSAQGTPAAEIDKYVSEMRKTFWSEDINIFQAQVLSELFEGIYNGKYRFTMQGFVDLIFEICKQIVRYCRDDDKLYIYTRGIWIENKYDIETKIKKIIEALRINYEYNLDPEYAELGRKWQTGLEKSGAKTAATRELRYFDAIKIDKDDFDTNLMLLNLKNLTYDLEDDRIRPHMPDHLHTRMAPVEFDRTADCPVFKQMISDTFDGDQETIEYMQRLLGYCLCGKTDEKRFWIFYGASANNGKTTLLKVMEKVLGKSKKTGYYAKMPKETIKSKSKDINREGVASFENKPRLVTADELAKGFCMNAEIMKELTGHVGTMPTRKLRQNQSETAITFKLILASNHLPTFDTFDPGILSRMTVIPFNHTFSLNTSLDIALEQELSGILNWLIEGYRMYTPECLSNLPTAIQNATDIVAPPLNLFLSKFTERESSSTLLVGEMHLAFNKWCTDSNRSHSCITKDMSTPLEDLGYRVDRKSNVKVYRKNGVESANGRPVVYGLKWKDASTIIADRDL